MNRKEQIQAAIDKITNRKAVSLSTRALMTEAAEWADDNPDPWTEGKQQNLNMWIKVCNDLQVERNIFKDKLAIAVEALEYIGNSIPGPEQIFELENKNAAKQALTKIKGETK